jgi:hypothetical protein
MKLYYSTNLNPRLAVAVAEGAQLPVGGYGNIARWHDRLNKLDAWRAPFAGLGDGEAPQAAAGGSR